MTLLELGLLNSAKIRIFASVDGFRVCLMLVKAVVLIATSYSSFLSCQVYRVWITQAPTEPTCLYNAVKLESEPEIQIVNT